MGSIVKTWAPDNEKNDKPGLSLKLKISKTGTGFVSDLKDGKDGNASNPLAGNNSLPPNPGNQTQTAAAPKKRAKKNKSNSTESTPFQNQGVRSPDKVAEVFDRHIRQRLSFWVLLKFTIRFCWAGYVKTNFRGKNLSKWGFSRYGVNKRHF